MSEIKQYCMSCIYFTPITSYVGYCHMLGVSIEKGVAIIDTLSTLELLRDHTDEKIYDFSIVQSRFGCVCYRKISML
jgi:hypothetical protein